MIQLITFTATLLYAFVFIRYVVNVRNIINDKQRRNFWGHMLVFWGILIVLFWIWLKVYHSTNIAGAVMLDVCYGLWAVNNYFGTQYAENEVKRRKEDKVKAAIHSVFQHSPLPYFFKKYDVDRGVFITVDFNKSFEDLILIPSGKTAENYRFSSDFDEWPQALAKGYDREDRRVYFQSQPLVSYDSEVQFGDFEGAKNWTKYYDEASGLLICFGNFDKL